MKKKLFADEEAPRVILQSTRNTRTGCKISCTSNLSLRRLGWSSKINTTKNQKENFRNQIWSYQVQKKQLKLKRLTQTKNWEHLNNHSSYITISPWRTLWERKTMSKNDMQASRAGRKCKKTFSERYICVFFLSTKWSYGTTLPKNTWKQSSTLPPFAKIQLSKRKRVWTRN